MIYDCFTYFNELDILDIRLEELNDVVDTFVIVESKRNFANKKRTLHFEQHQNRFAKYKDKIVYIVNENFDNVNNLREMYFYQTHYGYRAMVNKNLSFWEKEIFQRNQIMKSLKNCNKEDIILISDVDEIPSSQAIKSLQMQDEVVAFEQQMSVVYLNYVCKNKWIGTKAVRFGNLKSPEDVRLSTTYRIIKNGGWHFSSFGHMSEIRKKFEGYPHADLVQRHHSHKELLSFYLKYGLNIIETGSPIEIKKKIDASLPKTISTNPEKYKHLFHIPNQNITQKDKKLFISEIEYLRDKVNKSEMALDELKEKYKECNMKL